MRKRRFLRIHRFAAGVNERSRTGELEQPLAVSRLGTFIHGSLH